MLQFDSGGQTLEWILIMLGVIFATVAVKILMKCVEYVRVVFSEYAIFADNYFITWNKESRKINFQGGIKESPTQKKIINREVNHVSAQFHPTYGSKLNHIR